MIVADKNLLRATLTRGMITLQQKLIDLYINNLNSLSISGALVAGFAYTVQMKYTLGYSSERLCRSLDCIGNLRNCIFRHWKQLHRSGVCVLHCRDVCDHLRSVSCLPDDDNCGLRSGKGLESEQWWHRARGCEEYSEPASDHFQNWSRADHKHFHSLHCYDLGESHDIGLHRHHYPICALLHIHLCSYKPLLSCVSSWTKEDSRCRYRCWWFLRRCSISNWHEAIFDIPVWIIWNCVLCFSAKIPGALYLDTLVLIASSRAVTPFLPMCLRFHHRLIQPH